MAETKHKTTLEIGVDDKALKELASSMDRALSSKTAEAFEKSLERTAKTLAKLVEGQASLLKTAEKLLSLGNAAGGQNGLRPGGGGGGGNDEEARRRREERDRERLERDRERDARATRERWKNRASSLAHGLGQAGAMTMQEGGMAQALSAIPFIGPMFGAAYGSAQSVYSSFLSQQTAQAAAFGQTGMANIPGWGSQYGVMPAELPGLVGEFYGSAQVRGQEGGDRFNRALDYNKIAGVGLGTSGAYMNAASMLAPNGQRSGPEEIASLERAVSAGLEAGIRSARIDDLLGTIASTIEGMQENGILISPDSMVGMIRGMSSLGSAFRGQAGIAAAQSMMQGIQHAGDRGNLMGMIAIQEAGYGRGKSYMQSLMELEENPAEVAARMIPRFRGMGGPEEAENRAYMMRQQFSEIGVNLSARQAMQLAGVEGVGGTTPDIDAFTRQGGGEAFQQWMQENSGSGAFGAAATAAGQEYRRAGIGGEIARDLIQITNLELQMMKDTLPFMMDFMGEIAEYTKGLLDVFQEGGIEGVISHVLGSIMHSMNPSALSDEAGDEAVLLGSVNDPNAGVMERAGASMALGFMQILRENLPSLFGGAGAMLHSRIERANAGVQRAIDSLETGPR